MAKNEKKVLIIGSSRIGKTTLQSKWDRPFSISPPTRPTIGDPDADPSRAPPIQQIFGPRSPIMPYFPSRSSPSYNIPAYNVPPSYNVPQFPNAPQKTKPPKLSTPPQPLYSKISQPYPKLAPKLIALDTSSESDYDSIRPLSYKEANVVILCFSVVDRQSFQSIKSKWNKEVEKYAPNVPKILVGLKSDLRKLDSVSLAEGNELAKEIGAATYLECSAETQSPSHIVSEATRLVV